MSGGKNMSLLAYADQDTGDAYLVVVGSVGTDRGGFTERPTKAGVWLMFDGEAFAACTVLDNGVICYGDTLTTAQKLGAGIRYRFLCRLPTKLEDV